MSSKLQEPQGSPHTLSSVPESQNPPENIRRSRGASTAELDMSHYLYFEDNDCFFPPTELGQKPPRQGERRAPRQSLMDAEQPRAPEE
ncbi:hypothetical protein BDV32DRAFT_127417 [Aspergillus pseudonomiae]|uniref:Uncharacterized protein n=1 Tax=Aspergillus pseudonomiae TaxID=1506151 RepID=A0A5N7D368_9EURO|nr:uncharacterized protein BDV37DRAFT_256585 [Aspergillus pseudonomiae]KAB8257448.1 hypothetical protein BDV32DRAFT_127417 [Aspergillus pseudonomiae]KAE8400861.1 hypothetical protein BDV37DRAFT_256585 [Aspergillus pseudonomiae]